MVTKKNERLLDQIFTILSLLADPNRNCINRPKRVMTEMFRINLMRIWQLLVNKLDSFTEFGKVLIKRLNQPISFIAVYVWSAIIDHSGLSF